MAGLSPADPYAVLGVSPAASAAEIKSAYRTLVKRHHPDTNNGDKGAEERFKCINQAYNTLKSSLASGHMDTD